MIKNPSSISRGESSGVSAQVIVRDLRRKIVEGHLEPGIQLPTRSEIEAQFGASRVTVQRALDELRNDGWVAVNGRKGTYVASQLPHLTRYALIFPSDETNAKGGWVRFWTALMNEARQWSNDDITISPYFGIDGHEDSEDFQQLVRDIQAQRVGGLIFSTPFHLLLGTPLVDAPNVPRVVISSANDLGHVPIVTVSATSFWERSLDYLAARGRKRVAFLTAPPSNFSRSLTESMITSRGLETRPYWHQTAMLSMPEMASNVTHLLMHGNQTERPDALIVSDDNLTQFVGEGLLAAGVRVTDDIDVVAHCNFPYPTPTPVPMKRLGYDSRQILQACLLNLDGQRQNQNVAAVTTMPALFEEEAEPEMLSN